MNRRENLGLMAGALLAPLAAGAADRAAAKPAARGAAAADARIAGDALLTHVRVRGHQDGRSVYFWYQGTFYCQVTEQRTVPVMAIEGASSARMERQPDGSFRYRMREAGWFLDLQTKEVLQEWKNPFTGRVIAPRHYNSAQESTLTASGVKPGVELPPGVEYVGYIGQPFVHGDDVWTTEELMVRMPARTADGRPNVQTSLATFHAGKAAMLKSPDAWVPCTLAYQTLANWRPWMEMGDIPGVLSWRLAGRKCASTREIPDRLRERIEKEHPEALGV